MDNKNIYSELYSSRLLIFLESGPQSREYHQLLLTRDQFKKISKFIQDQMVPCTDRSHDHTDPCFTVQLNDEFPIKIAGEIQSAYSEDQIDAM